MDNGRGEGPAQENRLGLFQKKSHGVIIEGLDLLEVEKTIKKPRDVLWKRKYVDAFTAEYNIKLESFNDSETLFENLANGEPVTISYKYYLDEEKWVSHIVAAYSFDEEGIWVSDSLDGPKVRIPYSEVFEKNT